MKSKRRKKLQNINYILIAILGICVCYDVKQRFNIDIIDLIFKKEKIANFFAVLLKGAVKQNEEFWFICQSLQKAFASCNIFIDEIVQISRTEQITDFSSIIAIETLCSAVIVFIYSRYSEKICGIPSEFILEYKIGIKKIGNYRNIALALLGVSLISILLELERTTFYCTIVILCILLFYVMLATTIMQRRLILNTINEILNEEIVRAQKLFDSIIPLELEGGYYINEQERYKEKLVLKTKRQLREELCSNIINFLCHGDYYDFEFRKNVEDAYDLLICIYFKCFEVEFYNVYVLISHLLMSDGNIRNIHDWRINMMEKTFFQSLYESNTENMEPCGKCCAIILAILCTDNRSAIEFLWNMLYLQKEKRYQKIQEMYFQVSVIYIELLWENGIVCEQCINEMREQRDQTINKLYYCNHLNKTILHKLSLILSILEFGSQESIYECCLNILQDFRFLTNKDYSHKTMLGIILKGDKYEW